MTREWRSASLRAYQRSTRAANSLIAGAYLAGANSRRLRRALNAVFAGPVTKDVVSHVWRKRRAASWHIPEFVDGRRLAGLILEPTTSFGGVVAERTHHVHDNDFPWTTARPLPRRDLGRDARQPASDLDALDDMARSGPWMLFSGMVATGVGLAVVFGHQVWSGGALPIVVTLVGWAAVRRDDYKRSPRGDPALSATDADRQSGRLPP